MNNREKALVIALILLSVLATLYFRRGILEPLHFDEWINYKKTVSVLEGDLRFTRQAARGLAGVARSEVGLSLFLATLSKVVGVMGAFALTPIILNVLIVLLFYAIGQEFGFGLEAGLMALVIPCTPYLLGFKYSVAMALSIVVFMFSALLFFKYKNFGSVFAGFVLSLFNLFVHPAVAVAHLIFMFSAWHEQSGRWHVWLLFLFVVLLFIPSGMISDSYTRFGSLIKEFGLRNIVFSIAGILVAIRVSSMLRVLLPSLLFCLVVVFLFRLTGVGFLSFPPRTFFVAGVLLFLFCASFFGSIRSWFYDRNLKPLYYLLLTAFFLVNLQAFVVRSPLYSVVNPSFFDSEIPGGGRIVAEPDASYALHHLGRDVVRAYPYGNSSFLSGNFVRVINFLNSNCSDLEFINAENVDLVYYRGSCNATLWSGLGGGWWRLRA